MIKKIKIGTRGSELALWQANFVADRLGRENVEIVVIKTQGDIIQNVSFNKMEGKGFFTKEIEEALLSREIDLAVHSLKDMPTEDVPGLKIAVIPERGFYEDLLIISQSVYDENEILKIRKGSKVGTSSMRRMAQLKNIDSSLEIEPLRGNVNTRMRKISEGQYDAIVMARAGKERINLDTGDFHIHVLDHETFLPAPAQGALGLQIREGDGETEEFISTLKDNETTELVTAERKFLSHFGGGCHVPIGAFARKVGDKIILTGLVASPEGEGIIKKKIEGTDPEQMGIELSEIIKSSGADRYL